MKGLVTTAEPGHIRPAGSAAPRSELSFDRLAGRYNFEKTPRDADVFTQLVLAECRRRPSPVTVLDVGCGSGIARESQHQWLIKEAAGEYWGVEPNPQARPPAGLFDHHLQASLEGAELPAGAFDLAYSYMVMEHVGRPGDFLAAIRNCLRPGGSYIFVTPNRRHYFTRTASFLRAVGLDEWVLRRLRRSMVDEYHHPVFYRCNDEKTIRTIAGRLGFERAEFAYLEPVGPLPYFPPPLRFIFHLLAAKRRVIRNRRSLLTLACRLTRPPGD